MHIGVIGGGKMGLELVKQALDRGISYSLFPRGSALNQEPDIFLHFAYADSVMSHLIEAMDLHKPILIGTTGWESQLHVAKELIHTRSGTALFSPNFSIGVLQWFRLVEHACSMFPFYDRCGIDFHHRNKQDAPSGTAKWITSRTGISFSSLRLGNILPKLEVLFDGEEDHITITHQAKSRSCFASGALQVASWLCTQQGWKTIDEYLHSIDHPL